MAGLDPSVYQSGQHDGHSRITKRGIMHLRRIIWLRIEDGLPFKKAVLVTAHKLTRISFVLLTRKHTPLALTNSFLKSAGRRYCAG
jgi:transposase